MTAAIVCTPCGNLRRNCRAHLRAWRSGANSAKAVVAYARQCGTQGGFSLGAHETEEAAAEGDQTLSRVRDKLAALLRRQLRGFVSVWHEEHDDAVCRT